MATEKDFLEPRLPVPEATIFGPRPDSRRRRNASTCVEFMDVANPKPADIGRRIGRLDPYVMEVLKLQPGDLVQVVNVGEGARMAVKLGRPLPEDRETFAIRLDSLLQEQLAVTRGGIVAIRKVDAPPAESVDFVAEHHPIATQNEKYLALLLDRRVLTIGEEVTFLVDGTKMDYRVVNYFPRAEAVTMTLNTQIRVHRPAASRMVLPRVEKSKPVTTLSFADLLEEFVEDILDNWEQLNLEQKQDLRRNFITAACNAFLDSIT